MTAIRAMARDALRPLLAGVLWGAALVSGGINPALAQRAIDQGPLGQTAMSVPRPATPGGVPGLPQVLAPSDAARLRRIFDLQSRGDLAAAARESDRLGDRRLLGHVLADRFLRPGAHPQPAEVQAWLAQYADHPDAPGIHALLGRLLPRGATLPAPPVPPESLPPEAILAPEEASPLSAAVARNPALDRAVRERAQQGKAAAALALIQQGKGISPAYAGLLKADLAIGLFRAGKDEEALRIAAEAARAGEPSGLAAFAAGLSAWGLERWDAALPFFERAARTEQAAPALRAAAAFWTARAAVRARRPALYVPWMMQAAQEPRTFYGLVARRALGLAPGFAWEGELAGEAEAAAIAETAGGWRALALLQIGQTGRAEAELRQLWAQAQRNPGLVRAMMVVAAQASLTGLTSQLAAASQAEDGRPRDFARFPVPKLIPQGGFRVDPALLYALALQESRFDAGAVSPAGARGLMQIMPATASYLARDPSLATEGAQRLHDPGFSLELGQRYVHYLARHEAVEGNLIRLLAAYNAGPGNLLKWLPAHDHRDDPFLFVEAIPFDETRGFVQQVLTFSWIYASRLGLPAPSLDQLAAGSFPKFAGVEEVTAMLRQRGRTLH
ncbi:lytic transglycosylase domain-containing protein [Paracraurococcus lichenis]|uniref:Lytic transglycosylase domain-containing protein n=1 Tax=Paracraurococcus lichenis TaxID=3064888 RepID=A0ABT9E7X4_9PROT|nr:lytic transglycosylase domain-containing protein [Paracraurococcus sp. LOR1-02]MDO9712307.1 lytic transglycosylase domain-containing protein [Paracraurococcus sp. LOR1-02]